MSYPTITYQAGTDAKKTVEETPRMTAYLLKLSWAAPIRIWLESGEIQEIECGKETGRYRD